MKPILLLGILACAMGGTMGKTKEGAWSSAVNGLQARLSLSAEGLSTEFPFIKSYLELRNVSDVGNVMEIPFDTEKMVFALRGEKTDITPSLSRPYNELTVEVGRLRLPHDSSLKMSITHHGVGIKEGEATVLCLGSRYYWLFPTGSRGRFHLRATLEVAESRYPDRHWSGKLEIPEVEVPLE